MGLRSRQNSCLVLAILFFLALVTCSHSSIPSYACSPSFSSLPFCSTSLALADRVSDLVSRLTLQEKVLQLINSAAGVSRLGIPPYQWWSEALHGVSNTGPGANFGGVIRGAVSFPQVILTAASFNTSLWLAIGQVVSTEARAMYNEGQAGLTFWSPNINIYRDPRWGRGQETPGEDPFLTSQYAINYVRGLQGVGESNSYNLKVAACCKHYTAYDLDNWEGVDRFHFDAVVTEQDLSDTYQPPFKNCIQEGNAACVMCSYNRVNGVPSCVDIDLLIGTVRKQWGLNGYIASDCDSVEVLFDDIHYTPTQADAVADAILAGLNMNCGVFLANYTATAVAEGKITENNVDESLSYLYTVLMRLGYFNGDPASQEFGSLGPSDVCTADHRELAVEAAREGIVLLKNSGNCLPLSKSLIKTLAVIGPNADVTSTMIGNYAGVPCEYTTPIQGLMKYTQIVYAPGCGDVACSTEDLIDAAVGVAAEADAVVLFMGLDQTQEREGFDRVSLSFPGQQQNLIMQVANASKGRVVLVIMSGGPIDAGFAKNSPAIAAIVWVGYPGEAGGQAIAEVIFGDYNPAGRLPMSWYPENYTQIPMTNMNMRPNPTTGYPGRTYRFYTGETIFKFGDGLSYTVFSHAIASAPAKIALKRVTAVTNSDPHQTREFSSSKAAQVAVEELECEQLHFNVEVIVENIGSRRGDHVAMAFWHPRKAGGGAPVKQLVAFQRLNGLASGESAAVQLSLNACQHLSVVDEGGRRVVETGGHMLEVGEARHHLSLHLQ